MMGRQDQCKKRKIAYYFQGKLGNIRQLKLGKAINATEVAMKKQVIIIGAGPGGLAAAILLSKTGLKVKVLEKQGKVGGRTSSLECGRTCGAKADSVNCL